MIELCLKRINLKASFTILVVFQSFQGFNRTSPLLPSLILSKLESRRLVGLTYQFQLVTALTNICYFQGYVCLGEALPKPGNRRSVRREVLKPNALRRRLHEGDPPRNRSSFALFAIAQDRQAPRRLPNAERDHHSHGIVSSPCTFTLISFLPSKKSL